MFRTLTLLAMLALAGCQAFPGGAPAGASLQVTLAMAPAGYRVAETVVPYKASHIHHLAVRLYMRSGSPEVETPVTAANGAFVQDDITDRNFNRTLTFTNLRAHTKYRVRALAYKEAGFAETDLISTTGLSDDPAQRSYVDIDVADDTAPAPVGVLNVRLIDKPFDGRTTSPQGIAVTDGGFQTVPNEAIIQP
jgi:hypothetical protein